MKEILQTNSDHMVIKGRVLLFAAKKLLDGIKLLNGELSRNLHINEAKSRSQKLLKVKFVLSNLYNRLVELELCYSMR